MANLEFILGVLSTVGIFLVGYASIGVFKVKTQVKSAIKDIESAYLTIDEYGKDFNNEIKDLQLDYQNQIDELYRQLDSRFDKFENRIKKK
jgi:peptidoglycan hydrolase CwlO-like protein